MLGAMRGSMLIIQTTVVWILNIIVGIDGLNIALGKNAWQSSEYRRASGAFRSVDGKLESSERWCSITKCDKNPWWIVDLEAIYIELTALVYNRRGCGQRLRNYTLEISVWKPVGENFGTFQLCQHNPDPAAKGEQIWMECKKILAGRYLKIQIYNYDCPPWGCGGSFLQICEVEVYGKEKKTFSKMRNSRQNGPVFSNNTARSTIDCGVRCKSSPQCAAFNSAKVSNGVVCELLGESQDGPGHPTPVVGWDHYY